MSVFSGTPCIQCGIPGNRCSVCPRSGIDWELESANAQLKERMAQEAWKKDPDYDPGYEALPRGRYKEIATGAIVAKPTKN